LNCGGKVFANQCRTAVAIMKSRALVILLGVAAFAGFIFPGKIQGQGSAFTYQGRLQTNGVPLTGNFDMQFKLHPAASGTNQVGVTLTNAPVAVANGLFLVTLDFSAAPFTGASLWLEIGVRANGSTNAYDILSPTQLLTPTPYAIHAASATTATTAANATTFFGTLNDEQLSTNVAFLNGTNIFSGKVTLSNPNNVISGNLGGIFIGTGTLTGNLIGTASGTFSGNGAALTNVNVTNIVGIVAANQNWQLLQGTSQQAASGNSYLATNAQLDTLNLPTSPNVGEVFRFSGSGVNGWRLSQNANQAILTGVLGLPSAKNWFVQSSSPSTTWRSLASSTDGTKLIGAAFNGFLYTSTNAGQSWVQRASSQPWISVVSSADGTKLAAAQNNSFIAVSFDSGVTWTNHASSQPWASITGSADGTKYAAVANNGSIWTSTDGGLTWTQRATSQPWIGIAGSADGTKLAAAINNGQIWTSANSGLTWVVSSNSFSKPYSAIASSSDGTRLVAVANNDFIYTSGDFGNSWIQRATSQPWFNVASSGDGATLVAVINNGLIYNSFDRGLTWTSRTTGSQPWNAVCVSIDGTRSMAGINGGQIWTSVSATTTGSTGYLQGNQYSNVELQYIGAGQWMPLSFAGQFIGN
jgi:hypothetical protein